MLSRDGVPLGPFRSQKEAALLIYLAQTGQTHQREFVADLLWKDRSQTQALANLRTILARLRREVSDVLVVTRTTVALAPEGQQVDSVRLLETIQETDTVKSTETALTLQSALDLYRGPFLADFSLRDAPYFDEWALQTREHIRRQVVVAYDRLAHYAHATSDGEYGTAIARRWLDADPLDETAHVLLVRLLLEAGHVREALAHYEYCVQLLQTELDVAPPDKLTALVRDVQPKQPFLSERPPANAYHNLSTPYDQFFGRVANQKDIHARLDLPWCRLVTIVGQGGVGKTRLATTIARSRLGHYPDGVWLVELAEIAADDEDVIEAIAVEIASTLDLRLGGSATPQEQLLSHLQHQQMLLVLDNFEHLLDGVQIVLDILQRCPKVQLLVTSREGLGVRAEWIVRLSGLMYQSSDRDGEHSEAIELFVARRAQHRQELIIPDELAAIRAICHTVEGLPLAIELAAALTRHISSREVADRLQQGLDALAPSLRDIPDRHRTLRLVFEASWRTLPTALQERLTRLSHFRGGFTAAAAQAVADAELHQLAALTDKSLLKLDPASGRYALHPVVRAYALEKRSASDPTPPKHAAYYLTLLAHHRDALQKNAPQQAMSQIEPEIDNVRLAWQSGLTQGTVGLLSDALTALSIYYQLRGLSHEAEAVMQVTTRTTGWGAVGIALATRAGLEQARFQNRLGRFGSAIQSAEAALTLAVQSDDRWAQGMGNVWWAESLWRLGKYEMAKTKLQHALTLGQALDSLFIIGWCHHQLGIINDIQSQYAAAQQHLERACDAWQKQENAQMLSVSLNSLGLVCTHRQDWPAAQQALEEALRLCTALDNRHLQALLLNNLSVGATERKDFLQAHHYLERGLALATSTGNLTGQAEIYGNLGRNFRMLGDMEAAVNHTGQGLHLANSIANRSLVAVLTGNLAEYTGLLGDAEQAKTLYTQALDIARHDHLPNTECHVLLGLAELWREADVTRAKQYSAEAVALAEAIHNPALLDQAVALDRYLSVSAGRR